MLATPQIIQTTAEKAAVIHLTVPRNEMMKVFGPAVGEVLAALAAQGVQPAGAVFAHHLTFSPGMFNFEVGVKVRGEIIRQGNDFIGRIVNYEILYDKEL